MSDMAIRCNSISKRYRIAVAGYRHDTLRDQLVEGFKTLIPGRGRSRRQAGQAPFYAARRCTVWALENVSFEITQGEIVGIIGRNGAGKSTLLKILSRITEPTSGRAEIYGRVGSLLEVGTGFDSELTGRENIYLSGAILGMKMAEINRKFDEIVDFAEVEKFIDTPVKRYSSGMHTRLAFAVAAHLEPEILLIDEVLAVGDAAFQKKCLGKMDEVRKGGRTVLFVSHNMAVVKNLCKRSIFMSGGRVIEDGPTEHCISTYLAESSNLTHTSVSEREDRTGAGEIRIDAIEFLNNGKPIAHPVSGQELVIRLYYRAVARRVLKNCRVSVAVHRDEHPYFLLSTELVDKRPLEIKDAGFIDFVVPELPLSAGEYYVDPFIESNRIIQDWIIRAAAFSVIDGDFYGTGRNYPAGWQGKCVLVRFHWNANNRLICYNSTDLPEAANQNP